MRGNKGNMKINFLKFLQQLKAVLHAHLHIKAYELRLAFANHPVSIGNSGGRANNPCLAEKAGEYFGQRINYLLLVVDNDYVYRIRNGVFVFDKNSKICVL